MHGPLHCILLLLLSTPLLLGSGLLLVLLVPRHLVLSISHLLRALGILSEVIAAQSHVLLGFTLVLRSIVLRLLSELILLLCRRWYAALVVILLGIHLHLVKYVDVVVCLI